MISKIEILKLSKLLQIPVSTVEKDYALGWILAGISEQKDICNTWVFKGGTCLKKCYFKNYRFSEDLDFTILSSEQIDSSFLRKSLSEVAKWVYEESGIEFIEDTIKIDIYSAAHNRLNVEASIKYRGPLNPKTNFPRIKFDITADEIIVSPPQQRTIFHEYSDYPHNEIKVLSYSIEELFTEKLRALADRCRPRDLYDVVYLFKRQTEFHLDKGLFLEILSKKFALKNIKIPTWISINHHPQKQTIETQWKNMLAHQLPNLPNWHVFWKQLEEILNWINISS